MILIVSAADDDHVAAVEPELQKRGASVVRLDLAELPVHAQLTVAYQQSKPGRIVLRRAGVDVDLREVTAVWSRRPQAASPDAEVTNQTLRDYVRQETTDAWFGVASLLDCLWLPAPRWQELRATYKALQLRTALDLGFEIPATLVTNSPRDVLEFHREHNGAIIRKTVHNRLLPVNRTDGYDAYVLTEPVAGRDMTSVDTVLYCPVTVQPYVDKRVELRTIVVGDRVFSAEVDSQWTNHTRYDWRRSDIHRGRYAIHELPPAVKDRCVAIVGRLGLSFGAIDLILTPDGRYVFLEINPDGTWLWVERVTGLPIAAAMADLLVSGQSPRAGGPAALDRDAGALPAVLPGGMPGAAAGAAIPPTRRLVQAAPSAAAVDAVSRYLVRLARAGTQPEKARAGLRRLAKRHPRTDMELLWETEACLGAIHYDVLLGVQDGGTLSMAWSPAGSGVPWALRHAHHARETDLVRVNGAVLNMQTVMGYLDGLWLDARLVSGLVDGCLMREAIDPRGIAATDGEVRRAVTAFERTHALTSADAKDSWLRQRGWTADDLDYEMQRQVVAFKLRKQVAAGRVEAYFSAHRAEFDMAVIARASVSERGVARQLARRVVKAGLALEKAVGEILAGTDGVAVASEIVTSRRRQLPLAYKDVVFAAAPGDVLGPFPGADGFAVLRVLGTERARLDGPTRDLVTRLLFDDWLGERRRLSTVEWLWGDAERAPARGGILPDTR